MLRRVIAANLLYCWKSLSPELLEIGVATGKSVLQRLKPHRFRWVCVVAKTTTYKDSRVLT